MNASNQTESKWKMVIHDPENPYLCRRCGSAEIRYRVVESSCGGYGDTQYECEECGITWWVDGPDA